MMTVSGPFYGKVKFESSCIRMGKMLKSHFLRLYERLMAKTYNILVIIRVLSIEGYLPLPLGYIHV